MAGAAGRALQEARGLFDARRQSDTGMDVPAPSAKARQDARLTLTSPASRTVGANEALFRLVECDQGFAHQERMVGVAGFEPATPTSRTSVSETIQHHFKSFMVTNALIFRSTRSRTFTGFRCHSSCAGC